MRESERVRESLFTEFFGDYPIIKVFDFLIANRIFDYSKTEICEQADVSWNTLETFWDRLMKNKIVTQTRTIGRAELFKLNTKNIMVKQLLEFNKKLMKYSIMTLSEDEIETPIKQKIAV